MKSGAQLVGADLLRQVLVLESPNKAKGYFKKVATKYAAEGRDKVRAAIDKKTGNLRRSIKSKSTRSGGAVVYADRSGGASGQGYHIHFQKKGTKDRKTKKGARRGVSPVNERIQIALDAHAQAFPGAVVDVVAGLIKKDLAKVGIK